MENSSSVSKIAIVIVVVGVLIAAFFGYRYVSGGDVVDVTMRVKKMTWRWDPDNVVVPANKKIRIHIFNEDDFLHGFGVAALGIDAETPPLKETVVTLPPMQPGEYPFHCSVICGEGHATQEGKIVVQ
ncbi:MAG: hypothetical protein A3C15_02045 [Candidatus Magasanikbacteria bacterium RIFCSPHIGHO2_02_FULL_50_9b]|uniref:Cytochrome oxidase subunit II copper A binding domain-containing protein n=1 Tax=Candidatus Magasanikbacteria bacterium RIFCSPHIGHO2_02_FULL_50_9b TaxID=1798682 RepID=A0A1F6M8B6_9BACT|nr:MAG: hypothetical protein A3C15_02045 [Candidatus Magasanikbacteria bacterium RIFCSPHIGHO2_02_FULL_50_9b]